MLAAEAAQLSISSDFRETFRLRVEPGTEVAVAVSGGSDSMALLRLCAAHAAQLDNRFFAVTVDHQLRPESAAEAAKVALWSKHLGIPHTTLTWQGDKPKTGIQAAARMARYGLMSQWCKTSGIGTILTAHTSDDQAETVAMRLRRSGTPRSLAGIWPETSWQGVRVVRPLLACRREQLRTYLLQLDQPWIDDPSNANRSFERIRTRAELRPGDVPLLVNKASQALAEVHDWERRAEAWMVSNLMQHPDGHVAVDRQALELVTPELAMEIARRLLQIAATSSPIATREVRQLVIWLQCPGEAGQQRRTLAGLLFAKRQSKILVAREWSRIAPEVTVGKSGRVIWDERFRIEAPAGCIIRPAGRTRPLAQNSARHANLPYYVLAGLPVLWCRGYEPFLAQFPPESVQLPSFVCETIGFSDRLHRLTAWNPGPGNLC